MIRYKKLYNELLEKNKLLNIQIENLMNLVNKLEIKNEKNIVKYKKGSLCSINGNKYELEVFNIVSKCKLNNKPFNLQNKNELGGSHFKNDIECIMDDIKIPIEIKKENTPDWMQCKLTYDFINNKWIGSKNNKIPIESKKIFESLLYNVNIFNNNIPPFMQKKLTHSEWLNIKKETNDFNDMYIDCKDNIINKLYKEKGCYYIQISNKGLYHLGYDICNFNVPEFNCPQAIRIRTKIHSSSNKNGFCIISVTASCKPKNINYLLKSNYTLDDINYLPKNLKYDK